MGLPLAFLAATVLVGLTAALALAHLARWPSRRGPPTPPVTRVQRAMRRYGVLFALVETGALVALLIVLFSLPAGSAEMWLVGIAAVCMAFMIGLWAAFLRPLNATMAEWEPEALPEDWAHHHARWTTYHRLRLTLAVIAITLLLMGLFARPAR